MRNFFKKFIELFKPKREVEIPYHKLHGEPVMNINEIKRTDKLSDNFRLSEFLKSQTASRRGIDNSPTDEHIKNMKILVDNVLQPLREDLGKPLVITSGYRSKALNDAIGGSTSSQHSKGQAADIECLGMSNRDLAIFIRDNYDFDQLILEFYNPDEGENSGWVHVSFSEGNNRKEVMTALKQNGTVNYQYGIY
jgi:hypothetical protein